MHGNCLATPVSDGRRVYVWMPNISLAACYDREGNRLWSYLLHPSRNQEHGMHGSPVLAGGKMIFFKMDLVALDAATGREAWKTDLLKDPMEGGDLTHASPAVLRIDGREFVLMHGHLVDAASGRIVLEEKAWKSSQDIATPIVAGETLYGVGASGQLHRAALPRDAGAPSLKDTATLRLFGRVQGAYTRGFVCASPLCHEGLLYAVDCMGSLYVVDDAAQKLLYRKNLGLGLETGCKVHIMGTCYASPVLAGGNLYVFGVNGIAVVFRPGREYREVARNRIEDVFNPDDWSAAPEGFSSTPVAEGPYLYVRGDKYLYCLGEK
jgi:outer membrane protein assembly factor BamB